MRGAGLLGLVLMLAGCGGGGEDASTPDAGPVPAPSGEVMLVGLGTATTDYGLVVTPTVLSVVEGTEGFIMVRPAREPAETFVVTVTSSAPSKLWVSPSSVSFDSVNWRTPRRVGLSGIGDADMRNESAIVEVRAPGVAVSPTVQVTVNDYTDQGLRVVPGALTIPEGTSRTFAVMLNAEPSATVHITVMSADSAHVTVSPATLDLTAVDYDMPHVVTVSALEDSDVAAEQVDVLVSSAGLVQVPTRITTQDND